jgi:hypothetical protein
MIFWRIFLVLGIIFQELDAVISPNTGLILNIILRFRGRGAMALKSMMLCD